MTEAEKQINEYKKYLLVNFGLDWTYFFKHLEDLGNQNQDSPLSDHRKFLLSNFGFYEIFHDLDDYREMIHRELRNKNSPIKIEEGMAFLRLYVLITMLDRTMDTSPDNDEDFKIFLLKHPLWLRIEKQARITLDLFRKNRQDRQGRKLAKPSKLVTYDDQFKEVIGIFGNKTAREEQWKSMDEFIDSINNYVDLSHLFFHGGRGIAISSVYLQPLMAFHRAMIELQKFIDETVPDNLNTLLSSSAFHNLEEKSKNFIQIKNKTKSLNTDVTLDP